jgi:cytochrome c peroxidase
MKRLVSVSVLLILFLLSSFGLKNAAVDDIGSGRAVTIFKDGAEAYAGSIKALAAAIERLDNDSNSVEEAKFQLLQCRKQYKWIEYFVEYFFETRVKIFNLAPVYEIEEPYMEYQSPIGMQVIEYYLFDDDPQSHKQQLLVETEVLHTTAKSLPSLLYERKITDAQILEALRLELIRVITLSITGYDAPEMKSGITEAAVSLRSFREMAAPYVKASHADSVTYYIDKAVQQLSASADFASFERLDLLTGSMLPLQEHFGKMVSALGLEINTTRTLNYSARNIFQKDIFNINSFSSDSFENTVALVALGKQLFFEKKLSGNMTRSCASCHVPGKYFTDALPTSLMLDGKGRVKRNAPSLLYVQFQHGQFSDASAKSLTEQVKTVLANKDEMNAAFPDVVKLLKKDKGYIKAFKSAFPAVKKKELVTIDNVATAIAAYERSLPVMTSRFDRYVNGDLTAMTANEKKGFDLFMGKAMCGSCHFAPMFNSLLPPYYNITEMESLGMTVNNNFSAPVADADSGRFHVFPIEFYIGAFKTPTVRNADVTAPYMHNGAFADLKQLMEFYNKGGGNGLGLNNPYQTLSNNELHLSDGEVDDVISFLKSLTDEVPQI